MVDMIAGYLKVCAAPMTATILGRPLWNVVPMQGPFMESRTFMVSRLSVWQPIFSEPFTFRFVFCSQFFQSFSNISLYSTFVSLHAGNKSSLFFFLRFHGCGNAEYKKAVAIMQGQLCTLEKMWRFGRVVRFVSRRNC